MKTLGSRQVLLGVLAVAVVVLAWVLVRATQAPPTTTTSEGPGAAATATRTPGPQGTDPTSGLPWVAESSLPREARDTLALIRAGGPFPFPRNDNKTFDNRERLLPKQARGYYREFTVVTPGSEDRGARRIITGSAGETYWTDDHYASFSRVREGT